MSIALGVEEAAVFLGTYHPRLDEKGRLFLPAKFRDQLAEGLVMTKGHERCLYVFTVAEFERHAEAIRTAPLSARAVRDYSRVFFAGASNEVPDRQGRVNIPVSLRDYARLTRDCAAVGASNHVEIWDAAAWATYLASSEQAFNDMTEEVLPGVF